MNTTTNWWTIWVLARDRVDPTRWYTTAEAARLTGANRQTIARHAADGNLPCRTRALTRRSRQSRVYLILGADLLAWLKRQAIAICRKPFIWPPPTVSGQDAA